MADSSKSPFPFAAGDLTKNIREDSVISTDTGIMANGDATLQRVLRSLGRGSVKSAYTEMLFGPNHRGAGNAVPMNNEQYGLTFFTRPNLNLSYDNIKFVRTLTPLLADNPQSIQRAIRAYLDPEGSRRDYKCDLVDPYNAFMPLLENNLVSISGWPDIVVDKYTSKEGMYKEQYSHVDGFPNIYNAYSLSANFRNIVRDPITYLFYVWTQYSILVHEGTLDPRPSSILENEIDYNTRIYRLTLDPSRRFVLRMNACGASFPVSNPVGSIFNISSDEKYTNRDIDQVAIEFQALGACPYDPILIQEFNDVVEIFNPNMMNGRRQNVYKKIPSIYLPMFNYKGYPHINYQTSELEWWISTELYEGTLKGVPGVTKLYFD